MRAENLPVGFTPANAQAPPWSVAVSPGPSTGINILDGVSCVSATDCIAAGYSSTANINQTLIESREGTNWSIVPSPNPGTNNYLFGVSCAAGACTATGYYTGGADTYETLIESGPAGG